MGTSALQSFLDGLVVLARRDTQRFLEEKVEEARVDLMKKVEAGGFDSITDHYLKEVKKDD